MLVCYVRRLSAPPLRLYIRRHSRCAQPTRLERFGSALTRASTPFTLLQDSLATHATLSHSMHASQDMTAGLSMSGQATWDSCGTGSNSTCCSDIIHCHSMANGLPKLAIQDLDRSNCLYSEEWTSPSRCMVCFTLQWT